MKVQQANLVKVSDENIQTTAWVEKVPKLKEGVRVRLKGQDDWWLVKKLYEGIKDSSDLDREWCVGGL